MKKYLIPLLGVMALTFAGISTARAGSWFEVGAVAWSTTPQLNLTFPKSEFPNVHVPVGDALDMGRRLNPSFDIVWHNSLPFVPDLRVEYGNLLSDGSTSVGDLCYDGTHYQGYIVAQVAMKLGRIQFYWNPIDNSLVNLRAGLGARWVSLNTAATGTVKESAGVPAGCPTVTLPARVAPVALAARPAQTTVEKESKSAGVVAWLPEISLGVTVHLPAHFNFLFNGSGLPYASSYLYDFRIGINYHFASGLIIGLGYRRWRLHLDNTDWSVNGDLDFKGPYAGIAWRF